VTAAAAAAVLGACLGQRPVTGCAKLGLSHAGHAGTCEGSTGGEQSGGIFRVTCRLVLDEEAGAGWPTGEPSDSDGGGGDSDNGGGEAEPPPGEGNSTAE
jgi:hypothetical protein